MCIEYLLSHLAPDRSRRSRKPVLDALRRLERAGRVRISGRPAWHARVGSAVVELVPARVKIAVCKSDAPIAASIGA